VSQESYNVLTTWALDGASLKILKKSFDQRWGEERQSLVASWDALRGGRPGPARIPTLRPPLD
jgi:phage tail sheath gpL-like